MIRLIANIEFNYTPSPLVLSQCVLLFHFCYFSLSEEFVARDRLIFLVLRRLKEGFGAAKAY